MMISWFLLAGNGKGLLSKRQKLFEVFGNGRVLFLNKCMCHQSVRTEIKLSHLTLEVQKFISKTKDVKPKCGILHSSQFVLLVISFFLFPVLAT